MTVCPHLLANAEGLCLDCGEPTLEATTPRLSKEEQEMIKELPEGVPVMVFSALSSGDTEAISRLATSTVEEYVLALEEQTDPKEPDKPRIRILGGVMFRPTWDDVWHNLLHRSYLKSLMLGYHLPLDSWEAVLTDTIQYKMWTDKIRSSS